MNNKIILFLILTIISSVHSNPLPLYIINSYDNLTLSIINPNTGNLTPYLSLNQNEQIEYSKILYMNSTTIMAFGSTENSGGELVYQYIDIANNDNSQTVYYTLPDFFIYYNMHFNPNTNLIYMLNETTLTIQSINPLNYQYTGDLNITLPSVLSLALAFGYVDTILDRNENIFYLYVSVTPFPDGLEIDYQNTQYPCSKYLGCNYLFSIHLGYYVMDSLDLGFLFKEFNFAMVMSSTSILGFTGVQDTPYQTGTINIVDFNPQTGKSKTLYKSKLPIDVQSFSADPQNGLIYLMDIPYSTSDCILSTYNYKSNDVTSIQIPPSSGYIIRVEDIPTN
ncbi:hypothetical protein DLAC_07862 [Tieghemostelium lacteum]|uniref:Uncharacterized protein n=1 Tax=Tieghemostelium lacteum TaxID=361077 RepID=A0A151ZAL1_TIELA|nr:hypothetical protein DLAC_07862 [Tieghemostelium lacteum]|eukprot:KYQ90975.1 hypothetical protein DLAC_07862 [Tieghemostelium lacteum]